MDHDGESTPTATRRALLLGAIGAGAVGVAGALGRPTGVRAADPNDVVLGSDANVATTTTKITNSGSSNTVFWAASSSGVAIEGSTNTSTAVYGHSGSHFGVYATSTSGVGLGAVSSSGVGVQASSETNYGVSASTSSPNAAAIIGQATSDAAGVQGVSGTTIPASVPKTGVFGFAGQDANARGVYGMTTAGRGVHGYATTGTAGYFSVEYPKTGISLRATGRVRFDKSAGIAIIPVSVNSIVVTPGIDLVSTSAVVATLMGSAGGTTNVHRVAVNATTNVFTIYLTADNTAANPVKVAWHVFG